MRETPIWSRGQSMDSLPSKSKVCDLLEGVSQIPTSATWPDLRRSFHLQSFCFLPQTGQRIVWAIVAVPKTMYKSKEHRSLIYQLVGDNVFLKSHKNPFPIVCFILTKRLSEEKSLLVYYFRYLWSQNLQFRESCYYFEMKTAHFYRCHFFSMK